MQRRSHNALDPRRGGWLDPLAATARQQLVAHALRPPLALSDMLSKPRGELLGVGDAALAVAQVLADLRAMTLDRATRPLVHADVHHRGLQLPSDEVDRGIGQLRAPGWKSAVARVVLQQQRKAKPRRTVLRVNERPLVVEHRPVLNKLVQIDR